MTLVDRFLEDGFAAVIVAGDDPMPVYDETADDYNDVEEE